MSPHLVQDLALLVFALIIESTYSITNSFKKSIIDFDYVLLKAKVINIYDMMPLL